MRNKVVLPLTLLVLLGCERFTRKTDFQPDPAVARSVTRDEAWTRFKQAWERCTKATAGEKWDDPHTITARSVDEYGFCYTAAYRGTLTQSYQFRQIAKPVIESYSNLTGASRYFVRLYNDAGWKLDSLFFDGDREAAELFAESLTVLSSKDQKGIK